MTQYITMIISAFMISIICGFVFIPQILNFCKAKNLYDAPNARKLHKTLVPRLGGIAFMPSMMLSFVIALFAMAGTFHGKTVELNLWSLYFMLSLVLIYAVGIIDDLIGLSAHIKFVVQIIAASLLPMAGLYINNLYGLFGIHEIPFWAGAPLTILAIVFIDNAINLIDGIDGLCASLSFIALIGFLFCFWTEGLYVYCILIAGLAGVLVPYFYFNVIGKIENNRKIFMGDSGSLTLGFILAFLFVKYVMDNNAVMPFNESRMALAYTFLIVPVFDVVRVVVHRLRTHRPLFDADKHHIHHKIMRYGCSMRQTLVVIVILSLCFVLINLLLYKLLNVTILLVLDILLYSTFHWVMNNSIRKKIEEERKA